MRLWMRPDSESICETTRSEARTFTRSDQVLFTILALSPINTARISTTAALATAIDRIRQRIGTRRKSAGTARSFVLAGKRSTGSEPGEASIVDRLIAPGEFGQPDRATPGRTTPDHRWLWSPR